MGSFGISRAGIYSKYPEETVLFPVYTTRQRNFALHVTGVIFTCKYFKFGLNTTGLSQSHFRNLSACSIIGEFVDVTYANLFVPLILRPTRITSYSASLIDNIFANYFCNDIVSGLFFRDVSDHPIFAIHYEQGINNDGKKSFVSFRD